SSQPSAERRRATDSRRSPYFSPPQTVSRPTTFMASAHSLARMGCRPAGGRAQGLGAGLLPQRVALGRAAAVARSRGVARPRQVLGEVREAELGLLLVLGRMAHEACARLLVRLLAAGLGGLVLALVLLGEAARQVAELRQLADVGALERLRQQRRGRVAGPGG